jgi:hypothetical protein
MNKFKKLNLLLGVILLTTITSCNNEPNLPETVSKSNKEDYIKLGKKLENPYSVKNMRLALENIKNRKASSTSKGVPIDIDPTFDVLPTHLYVEFQPESELEEAVLKSDSSIVLFDYPLDYEFADGVLESRPELAPNEVPNYYSAIKVNSEVAGEAQYQTLEQLYIPEEDSYFPKEGVQSQKMSSKTAEKREIFLNALLDEAYKITGNERQDTKASATSRIIFGKRWWPSGKITVYDEVAGANKPVVGAQVLIRQWFTVRQGITNENGDFSTSSVRGSARYILQWERYNYSIRNGSFFQAETRGSKETDEPWNLNITGGDDKYHAIIHQAAHDYYYGHRFGLISPPMNNHNYSFGRQGQIKIAARETQGGYPSSYSHIRSDLSFSLSAQIHIKAYGRASDRVYGTTIHELSHALHSVLDRGSYDNIVRDAFLNNSSSVQNRNRRLLETWPTTVEILITLDRYKTKFNNPNYEYGNTDGFFYRNMQRKTINSENQYTSGGYDLIDNFNQRDSYGFEYPIDRVSGYTIKQLQDALVGAKQWNDWKVNINNKYNNPTAIYLDELFNNWQN